MKQKFSIRFDKATKHSCSALPPIILTTFFAQAAEITKDPAGSNLSQGTSWVGGVAPGSDDVASWISTSLRSGLSLGADTTWSGVKVRGGGTGIGSGNILSLGAAGVDVSIGGGNTMTFSHALALIADQTWTIGGSTGLSVNGAVSGVARTIQISGESGAYVNFLGSWAGFSGTISYGAPSRLRLRGTFEGTQAALVVTSNTSVSAEGTIGTVRIGDLSTASLTASLGNTDQNGSVTYQVGAAGNNSTWAGVIRNGSGSITTSISKTGSGVWTLSGENNIFSGTTSISAGAIKLANASAISSSSAVSVNSANGLQFGTGITAVTLNDFGGTGALDLANDDSAPVTITANNANARTLGGIISGNGGLIKNGGATLTLGNSNTFAGGVILKGGRINLNTGSGVGSLGTGTVTLGVADESTVILDQSYRSISNPLQVNGSATLLYIDNRFSNSSTLSGSGTLTISGSEATTPLVNLGIGNMSGFTGTLNLIGGNFRKGTNSGSAAGALVNIDGTENSKAQYSRFDFVGTDSIGALSGNQYAILAGGNGTMTYEIGARDLDSTYAGLIRNGSDNGSPRLVSLTKVGTGKLTLSGTNTYTGDTTVSDGVLAVTGNSIADTNKVVLDGGTMELTGQETVNALFFGTTQQPAGTWGSTASEAANQDDSRFTGSGILNVTTGAEPADNFETWIGGFGLAQGVQGPSDDPDHDGLNNLLEYVMGGNPSLNDSPSIEPTGAASGSNYIFTFVRSDLSQSDTTQIVEYGNDLAVWGTIVIGASPGVSPVSIAEDSPNAGLDTVTVTIPTAGAAKFFARLKVTK